MVWILLGMLERSQKENNELKALNSQLKSWSEKQSIHASLKYTLIYYIYRVDKGSPSGSVVKNLPAVQETWFQSLGLEDPLEKKMACLENLLNRGTWQATIYGVAKRSDRTGGLNSSNRADIAKIKCKIVLYLLLNFNAHSSTLFPHFSFEC